MSSLDSKMFTVSKFAYLFLLICLVIKIIYAEEEYDDVSVCKLETKKGLTQLKEKYKERIQLWKDLHKRGCKGKLI